VAGTLGHRTTQSLEDCPDVVVCADYSRADESLVKKAKYLNIPTVLIINEPCVVIPEHCKPSVLCKFDFVLEVGRPASKNLMAWPQTWRSPEPQGERLPRAVLVNADKWSFVRGGLYGLRAKVAKHEELLDTWGHGWERARLSRTLGRLRDLAVAIRSGAPLSFRDCSSLIATPLNFMGIADDKVRVMGRYKVALVIENSEELMTEKLFDAFFAGCIPVYVGPRVADFGIPSDLVIQAQNSHRRVRDAIGMALKLNQSEFTERLHNFMSDPEIINRWQARAAIGTLIQEVVDFVDSQKCATENKNSA
jgi:hypothetical protein